MLKNILFICFLLFVISSYGQSPVVLDFSNGIVCNYLHISSDHPDKITVNVGEERARRIVTAILEPVGLLGNFEVVEGPVANAMASHKDGKRYIVYNKEFMDRIYDETQNDFSLIAVLAHVEFPQKTRQVA